MTEIQKKIDELNKVIGELAALAPTGGLYIEDIDCERGLYSFNGAEVTDKGSVKIVASMWSPNAMAKNTGLFNECNSRMVAEPTASAIPEGDLYTGTEMQRQDDRLYAATRNLISVASMGKHDIASDDLIDFVGDITSLLMSNGVPVCRPWALEGEGYCADVNWGDAKLPCQHKECMCAKSPAKKTGLFQ